METKKHYKMYKSGKLWVSAAVATFALTAGMAYGPSANADTAQPTQPTPAAKQTTSATDKAATNNQTDNQTSQGQTDQPTTNNTQNTQQSNKSNQLTGKQSAQQDNKGNQPSGNKSTPNNDNKGSKDTQPGDKGNQPSGNKGTPNNDNKGSKDTQPDDKGNQPSGSKGTPNNDNKGNQNNQQDNNGKKPTDDQGDQSNKNVDLSIKGNFGSLDVTNITNNQLHVVGWNATNDSKGKPYHYIFVLDKDNNGQEVGRYQVDTATSDRQDVVKVDNVWNAAKSGFDVPITLNLNKIKVGDRLQVMSRWTIDPAGNVPDANSAVNFYFPNLYTIEPSTNQAWLDSFGTWGNNQLKVSGWNATSQSLNFPYHWLILFDATTHKEISRQKVINFERADVAKVNPTILNADKSGFEGVFSLKGVNLIDSLQVVSRYSSDMVNGEGQRVDYWFPAQKLIKGSTTIEGSLDTFELKDGRVHAAGWNATDWSTVTQNHFLILWDDTAKKQVASKLVVNIARPDVAKACPSIKTAGNSGFDTSFDPVVLVAGHTYSLISRYSTSNEGNGGTGANVTWWFVNRHLTFNPNRENVANLDGFDISNGKLQVTGWHATDISELESNHWLILLDSNNKEVARVQVANDARPDVAAAFKGIKTAGNSGFTASFDNLKLKPGTYTLVSRYAIDPNNSSQYTDYWFKDAIKINPSQHASNIDSFTENKDGSYQITGWMASNATMTMKDVHPYLILVNEKGQELGLTEVKLEARPDVAEAFPTIYNSAISGFNANLKLNKGIKIDN
ncbi:KxYKxGKxW signal peptide domain-containing protein [Limosilactobacillus panis]|uniref:KxYKxGKxW signal domain protein n=1 Tax=Limosilactobacillus panis DSM 6035 TaxID=1423782 RepID=A0A0R1XED4_9LACO|nr:KxYKxGKxW signal peptide domain-containing protein [Limosilactobacillus panis]KRM25475.1 hypothetical protein FD32_GL000792 [Limosilactobacillus panis DSM 6035]